MVVIVLSILLETVFSQTSIYIQSLAMVEIGIRQGLASDKDKIIFKAIEKHRYGVRETVSKHVEPLRKESLKNSGILAFFS